jgi:hypothetical protein
MCWIGKPAARFGCIAWKRQQAEDNQPTQRRGRNRKARDLYSSSINLPAHRIWPSRLLIGPSHPKSVGRMNSIPHWQDWVESGQTGQWWKTRLSSSYAPPNFDCRNISYFLLTAGCLTCTNSEYVLQRPRWSPYSSFMKPDRRARFHFSVITQRKEKAKTRRTQRIRDDHPCFRSGPAFSHFTDMHFLYVDSNKSDPKGLCTFMVLKKRSLQLLQCPLLWLCYLSFALFAPSSAYGRFSSVFA